MSKRRQADEAQRQQGRHARLRHRGDLHVTKSRLNLRCEMHGVVECEICAVGTRVAGEARDEPGREPECGRVESAKQIGGLARLSVADVRERLLPYAAALSTE